MFSEDPSLVRATLRAAGFEWPMGHPLLTPDGAHKDSRIEGFEEVHTGGGCMAMRRDFGEFYIVLTASCGCDLPDPEDQEGNLIGVYHESLDEDLVCVTSTVWEHVITGRS